MAQADRFAPAIIAGKATKATMLNNDTYAQAQGELGIATDEARFFIGDSSYRFSDLCNFVLPWVIVDAAGNVVTHNGEIVWS